MDLLANLHVYIFKTVKLKDKDKQLFFKPFFNTLHSATKTVYVG